MNILNYCYLDEKLEIYFKKQKFFSSKVELKKLPNLQKI